MGITVVKRSVKGYGYWLNAYSADASGCEEMLSAQGSGTNIVLHSYMITCQSNTTASLGASEISAGGSLSNTYIGPLYLASGVPVGEMLRSPLILSANKPLCLDAGGAADMTVMAFVTVE